MAAAIVGAAVVEGGEGVIVEGAMGGGEGGDEAVDAVLGGGGPGVVADVPPELLVGGDSVEVGRRTGCGGDCWAVESGEDVGLNYIGMDGGDIGGSAVWDGCRRIRIHTSFSLLFFFPSFFFLFLLKLCLLVILEG